MKIKANGININCQIDGPEGAPWLVFSNSLATSLAMWDEQAAALKVPTACCATISAAMAAPTRRLAVTRSIPCLPMRSACLMPRYQEGALRRAVDGRRHRAWPRRAPSRTLRSHHRLRFAMPVDAAVEPAMGRAYRHCPEAGHRRACRTYRFALGSAGNVAQNPPHLDKIRAMIRARRSTALSVARRRWPTTTTPPRSQP